MGQAKVEAIDALRDVRDDLVAFGEGGRAALVAVDMEIRRAVDWVERDRPAHWRQEIKRADLATAEARSSLHRKNLQRTSGYSPDTTVETEALRHAKARRDHAERQLEKTRRWVPVLQHAIAEYHGRSRPLADAVGPDLERSLAVLDRMVMALEGYVGAAPPRPSATVAEAGPAAETPDVVAEES